MKVYWIFPFVCLFFLRPRNFSLGFYINLDIYIYNILETLEFFEENIFHVVNIQRSSSFTYLLDILRIIESIEDNFEITWTFPSGVIFRRYNFLTFHGLRHFKNYSIFRNKKEFQRIFKFYERHYLKLNFAFVVNLFFNFLRLCNPFEIFKEFSNLLKNWFLESAVLSVVRHFPFQFFLLFSDRFRI